MCPGVASRHIVEHDLGSPDGFGPSVAESLRNSKGKVELRRSYSPSVGGVM
jgi:hypothetical protein